MIKKKDDKLYVKWKEYDSSYVSWIDKPYILQNTSQCFPKPYSSYKNIKVELYLFNYATKSNVKKQHMSIDHNLQKRLSSQFKIKSRKIIYN